VRAPDRREFERRRGRNEAVAGVVLLDEGILLDDLGTVLASVALMLVVGAEGAAVAPTLGISEAAQTKGFSRAGMGRLRLRVGRVSVAMSGLLLADITSRETGRVYAAMWALVKLRDEAELDALAAALPEIERATANLDLRGIVYSNNATLAFALRRLRYHRDRAGCLCALYPDFLLYDPETEAEAGNVSIVETGRETWRCECTNCGAVFKVQYGEAHASWWDWTPVGE
jgi:hypothetical protein